MPPVCWTPLHYQRASGEGAWPRQGIGLPTSNLKPTPGFLLPNGIYAGYAKLGDQAWKAAIDVGIAPTLRGKDRRIEVHMLGFAGELYRRTMEVHFLKRIREERRFSR